jgi:hypothetical protein
MYKKGFIPILVLVVGLLAIATITGGVFYVSKNKSGGPSQVACTMEAKQCPDGSYVGRTGPNCEFAACPGATSTVANSSTSSTSTWQTYPSASSGQAAMDISDWKLYRNEKYGFEVKYPPTAPFQVNVYDASSNSSREIIFYNTSSTPKAPQFMLGVYEILPSVVSPACNEDYTDNPADCTRVLYATFQKQYNAFTSSIPGSVFPAINLTKLGTPLGGTLDDYATSTFVSLNRQADSIDGSKVYSTKVAGGIWLPRPDQGFAGFKFSAVSFNEKTGVLQRFYFQLDAHIGNDFVPAECYGPGELCGNASTTADNLRIANMLASEMQAGNASRYYQDEYDLFRDIISTFSIIN